MWRKFIELFGSNIDKQDLGEILSSFYQEVKDRNLFFHLLIIAFEVVMAISISLRPGGPFAKPRRVAYFLMYMILILVTAWVTLAQLRLGKKKPDSHRSYFRIEHAYMVFFSFWGIAVTLNDQLGGNGLTVYNYVILILAIMSLMKPWQTTLLFMGNFVMLNVLLPYFPDPAGLDNRYNNFMNSLFLTLAAITIAIMLYNSKMQAKKDEIIIKRQYQQIETANIMLSREALTDALTNLQNRNSFNKTLLTFNDTDCTSCACIYIDVNGLHEINNHLGHEAGDLMLKATAGILLNNFRDGTIFRIGGDEFVILCKNISQKTITERMDSIRKEADDIGCSFSSGIEWREGNLNISAIIQDAESDMQRCKRDYYSTLGEELRNRSLNRQIQLFLSVKKDAERFIGVLAPVFEGVYFVNLETDTVQQLHMPSYFKELLDQAGNSYRGAVMLFAHQLVEPEYIYLFEQACDYRCLETMLEGEEVPGFTYRKKDGSRHELKILRYGSHSLCIRDTMWFFSHRKDSEN